MKSNRPVALITGAAKRLGASFARLLHANEYNVVIHYRHSKTDAEALCQSLNNTRANSAVTIQADFENTPSLLKLIKEAHQQWQRLDVLINNASDYFPTKMGKTTEAQWQTLMASNLKAPYFLSQTATPYLRQTQGCIVNISDVNALLPLKNYPVYCTAKAGLNMLTKALALELGPEIRVNAVAPGPTLWPEGKNAPDEATKLKSIDRTILKRKGEPNDIASAVIFLIQHSHITGHILNVDGGKSAFL